MTWRRLRVLIEALPPESATWTALRNEMPDDAFDDADARPEQGRWSQVEMLLAAVIEAIRDLDHHQICINWDTKRAPRPPVPPRIRRPGWKPPATVREPSPDWAWAHLDAMLNGTV